MNALNRSIRFIDIAQQLTTATGTVAPVIHTPWIYTALLLLIHYEHSLHVQLRSNQLYYIVLDWLCLERCSSLSFCPPFISAISAYISFVVFSCRQALICHHMLLVCSFCGSLREKLSNGYTMRIEKLRSTRNIGGRTILRAMQCDRL